MNVQINKSILAVVLCWGISLSALTQAGIYSGGEGTAANPYQISTVNDWMELIGISADWNKHFILTATIDFEGAAIAPVALDKLPGINGFQGTAFTGMFDGGGHVLRNFVIDQPASDYVGLFGQVDPGGKVRNLGVEPLQVIGRDRVGGLCGYNFGTITSCYATGAVSGTYLYAGGLCGYNCKGTITFCYATGAVSGSSFVGGLCGQNDKGTITSCYATGAVSGTLRVGGLCGQNPGTIISCYATGTVSGTREYVGGLCGENYEGTIIASFWDIQTSGQIGSDGGKGVTTEQMKKLLTFQNAGWAEKGWVMNEGQDYPRLNWENTGGLSIPTAIIPFAGSGTSENPYLISTTQEFALLSWHSGILDKCIKVTTNIDLTGVTLYPFGDLGPFTGIFDGNGCTISNAVINQPNSGYVGLFSYVGSGGQVFNLGVENINVKGKDRVGGLCGYNFGTITSCYATGAVSGNCAGGLCGWNYEGTITSCYATGTVSGSSWVGGLCGDNSNGIISFSFWDIQTSGRTTSAGGTGKTTAEMKTQSTFTLAGWDFVSETANGTDDIWWMRCEGMNYPKLSWQIIPAGDFSCPEGVNAEDMSYFVAQWLLNNCTPSNNYCGGADLNYSGVVDLVDWAIFAENWLLGG